MHHFPWLTVVTFLPLAGAVVVALLPNRATNPIRLITLLFTLATFGFSVGLLFTYQADQSGFQLIDRAVWVRSLNFQYILGVDGISLFMVLLTTFLMPAAVMVSWNIERQTKFYMAA